MSPSSSRYICDIASGVKASEESEYISILLSSVFPNAKKLSPTKPSNPILTVTPLPTCSVTNWLSFTVKTQPFIVTEFKCVLKVNVTFVPSAVALLDILNLVDETIPTTVVSFGIPVPVITLPTDKLAIFAFALWFTKSEPLAVSQVPSAKSADVWKSPARAPKLAPPVTLYMPSLETLPLILIIALSLVLPPSKLLAAQKVLASFINILLLS